MAHNIGDLRDLPLERFANFVYWMATRNGSPADVEKFRAKLWRPPKGEAVTDSRSPWAPENEQRGLSSLKMSLGMGAPPKAG